MKKLNKWFISYNNRNELLQIVEKNLSADISMNRMLNEARFYNVNKFVIDKRSYLNTSKPEETLPNFTILLVAKIKEDKDGDSLIDMTSEDITYIKKMAKKIIKKHVVEL